MFWVRNKKIIFSYALLSGGLFIVGARVGFAQDMGPTPISKAGKMPSEDPSVGVIKNIMK